VNGKKGREGEGKGKEMKGREGKNVGRPLTAVPLIFKPWRPVWVRGK